MSVADERARIARDLHDTVIQRLFGEGLKLQAIVGGLDEADIVPIGQDSRGDPLQAKRLESQEDLGVHQRTGMNQQNTHKPRPPLAGRSPAGRM